MNKFLLAALVAAAPVASLFAQDELVKDLYTGDPVNVTWENTLQIAASEFAEGIEVGNYIDVTFSRTTDVIELKANGTWLPGTRYINLGDNTPSVRTYITKDMLNSLQAYGLELCGADFTVSGVSVRNDGFQMPEGAIWGGYFWVDNWNTLELWKTAFDAYDGQRYMEIHLSDDNGDNTGYFMKVLTAWDNPDAIWADNDAITHQAKVATVDLENIDVKEALSNVNALMIQSNPEGGNPYNITAITLRNDITSVTETIGVETANVNVYTIEGIMVKENVKATEATVGLPHGFYIVGGKKVRI